MTGCSFSFLRTSWNRRLYLVAFCALSVMIHILLVVIYLFRLAIYFKRVTLEECSATANAKVKRATLSVGHRAHILTHRAVLKVYVLFCVLCVLLGVCHVFWCAMSYVLCYVSCVLRLWHVVLCLASSVLRPVFRVLCPVSCALRPMRCVLCGCHVSLCIWLVWHIWCCLNIVFLVWNTIETSRGLRFLCLVSSSQI